MNVLRAFSCAAFLSITFLLTIVAFAPLLAESPAGAVVAIDANQDGKFDGHGVAWKLDPADPGSYVVTTLHLVAGRGEMTIHSEYGQGSAVLDRAYTDVDLALLRVSGVDLPSIELDLSPTPPRSANYWAYDNLGRKFDNFPIKLRGKKQLNSLHVQLKKPANLEKFTENLCKPAYPSIDSDVLKLKTPVQPGHSGSPIINDNGQLVGLVDGGLINIGIQNVFWSIPAHSFEQLWHQDFSGRELALCSSDEKFLYSGVVTEIDEANRYAQLVSLGYSHSMLFRDIYQSLLDEDRKNVDDLLEGDYLYKNGPAITIDELFRDTLDIYMDFTSGAIISFPRFRFAVQQFDMDDLRDKFLELENELKQKKAHLDREIQEEKEMNGGVSEEIKREYNKRLAEIKQNYIPAPPPGMNLIYFDGSNFLEGELNGVIAVAQNNSKAESDAVKKWFEKFLNHESFNIYIMGEMRFDKSFTSQFDYNVEDWMDRFGYEDDLDYDDSESSFYSGYSELMMYKVNGLAPGYFDLIDRQESLEEGTAEYAALDQEIRQFEIDNQILDYVIESSITIDQFDFLGVAFRAGDYAELERHIRKRYYLMKICNILSGFQYN